MPIYEYVCGDCAAPFEELVSLTQVQAPACPACGSKKTQRQLSRSAACVKPGLPFATPGAPAGGCGGKGFS